MKKIINIFIGIVIFIIGGNFGFNRTDQMPKFIQNVPDMVSAPISITLMTIGALITIITSMKYILKKQVL
jgi:hypothetical protein